MTSSPYIDENGEFCLGASEKDLAGADHVLETGRALLAAVERAQREGGLTRKELADRLGVDKSVVTRMLTGNANLTLKTLGEIAWAIGCKARTSVTNENYREAIVTDASGHQVSDRFASFGGTKIFAPQAAPSAPDSGYYASLPHRSPTTVSAEAA